MFLQWPIELKILVLLRLTQNFQFYYYCSTEVQISKVLYELLWINSTSELYSYNVSIGGFFCTYVIVEKKVKLMFVY